jgi:putative SOS response-associated peptidase YedK
MRDTADLVLLTGAVDETGEPDPAAESSSGNDPAAAKDPVLSANIAPTDRARVLLEADGRLVIRRHTWGLIPPWSKGPQGAARMINARIETVADKPSYRRAIRTARCLLPADGWYEWRAGQTSPAKEARRPYLVSRADGEPLWLAGVWARWHPPGGGPAIASAAVLTGPAPPQLQWLHERAPLVVADSFIPRWLASDGSDPSPVLDTLASLGYPPLTWHAVSREIGQVRVKDARLMLAVPAEDPTPVLF